MQDIGTYKDYDWVIDGDWGYIKMPEVWNSPRMEEKLKAESVRGYNLYLEHRMPITNTATTDLWVKVECSKVLTELPMRKYRIPIPCFKRAESLKEAEAQLFRIIDFLSHYSEEKED